jgi:hydrogenase maturation protease
MKPLLMAGLGNIFKGDDAFGVEVVKRLGRRPWPAGVDVVDFGINGIDLTYALLDDYDRAVLIDTLHRDGAPGALYVIEPESPEEDTQPADLTLTPHALDPAQVLRMVHALGGRCREIVLIGCEPADFGDELEGKMGLSAPVAAAVDEAAGLAESLVAELTGDVGQWCLSPCTSYRRKPVSRMMRHLDSGFRRNDGEKRHRVPVP